MHRERQGSPPIKAADMESVARDHYQAIYRFCARRVGPDRAADAAQETFLTAQKCIGKFRGESTLSTWLYGIAHNECRRIVRKMPLETTALTFDILDPHPDSERSIVDRHALDAAMQALTHEHREAVILHEIDGLTYEEAAQVLGIPVGTVKSRLHHAFINLRRSLFPADALGLEVTA